jgi:ornithine carbamoyltransferase
MVSAASRAEACPTDVVHARRHLLSVLDLAPGDVAALCRRAVQVSRAGSIPSTLLGRTVGIYFRATSTRTRTAFTVGAGRLGATVISYGPSDLQTNTGETLQDTARVLAGYVDLLVMRTNESIEQMKLFAAQPGLAVVNALSDDEHPTQALADLTTMLDHFGRLDLSVLYCGEGNTTAAALALAMSRIPAARLILATPAGYGVPSDRLETIQRLATIHGAIVEQVHDVAAVPGRVDVVYTSRWQEMGVSKPDADWRRHFLPFRVTNALMRRVSGPNTMFMHDLPAVRGEDVDDEVLDGPQSLAWVQARHKLFSAMSVLEYCAGVPVSAST